MNERIKNLIKKHGLSGVNSPKKTPSHPTKKGIVLAKEGDRYKLIRFGDQNMGHNYSPEARKSFKARHAQNIAKGKMSAAYWADKAFWGGEGADKKMPPKSQEYTRGLKNYQDGGKITYDQWKAKYNLKETPDYNLKRAWELGYTPDKNGHLPSVDNQTLTFLKKKDHSTIQKELDWYNSDKGANFRKKYDLDTSGEYYKYVPVKKYADGGKVPPNIPDYRARFNSKKKYEPSDVVKRAKAALAVASNLPLVSKYAAIGSAVGDAYTAARYYADGNKSKAKEDLIQAGLSLVKPFRGKAGVKLNTFEPISKTKQIANKALKASQVSSDAKTVYESKNEKKYAEGGKIATKSNPELWRRIVASVKAGSKGGDAGEWSARKAQLAVQQYKKSGGSYKGPKKETSLSKWTKQEWTTSSGKPSEGKRRYLPKAAWAALSSAQKAATNKAKAEGNKKGKQFVPQPKAIAKKTAQYR